MNSLSELFSLRDKTVLVTGATGHLGRAMAKALADAGATVYINSRSSIKSKELVTSIRRSGGSAEIAVFDITDKESIHHFFEIESIEALHVLVNNAYNGNCGVIENSEDVDYINSYTVSVIAAHEILRSSLSALRSAVRVSGDASVINIASMYGLVSPDLRIYESPEVSNPPFYGAAKAALIQWTRYAACEFGKEGIRVNALSPGPFPSEEVQVNSPAFVKKLAAKVPMNRIGQSEEIAGPLLFLASKASRYVNGANLIVDGGWTAW